MMDISLIRSLLFLSASVLAASCVSKERTIEERLTLCPETRPQICPQNYKPVCASLEGGGHKTYPNGCSACADVKVIGYKSGECVGPMESRVGSPR